MSVYGARFGKCVESDVGMWRQLCAERSECCRYMRFWAPEDGFMDFGEKVMSVYGGRVVNGTQSGVDIWRQFHVEW